MQIQQPLLNSKSRELLDPALVTHDIVLIGCGAIGSHLAVSMARMGLTKIKFFDFDVIESKNVNNQAYFNDQVGMNKVDALYDNLVRINGLFSKSQFINKKFEKNTCNKEFGKDTIIILAVDVGRQEIHNWLKNDPRVVYMIETGISHDVCRVQVVDAKTKKLMEIARPDQEITPDEDRSACGESLSIGGAIEICTGIFASALRGVLTNRETTYLNKNNRVHTYPYFEEQTCLLINN